MLVQHSLLGSNVYASLQSSHGDVGLVMLVNVVMESDIECKALETLESIGPSCAGNGVLCVKPTADGHTYQLLCRIL